MAVSRCVPSFASGLILVTLLATPVAAADASDEVGASDRSAVVRPNVLVVLTDDQGWGDLSLHGNRNLQTPNLDALARRGAQFRHFYVQPVCSPTRAEFLTGRWHPRGGVFNVTSGGERLDLDETTIADAFHAAGYRTALFGKWHNGTQGPYHPIRRGFDQFYGFTSGHWGHYFSPLIEENNDLTRGTGYLPDDLTNHAIDWIKTASDQPTFTVLTLNTPHSPMQVPDTWWQRVAERPLQDFGPGADNEDVTFTRAAMAMVENIDWNVGRLIATLHHEKLLDNTIVVFFCDNGPNSDRWNGGLRGHKGTTDEGGTRSPLFISWPDHIAEGSDVQQIAGAVDLLPTLLELTDIPLPESKPLDGHSLVSSITNPAAMSDDRVLFAHWNKKVSARNQQFRLDDKGRLYDIESDDGQTQDVATIHPDVHRQLSDAVAEYRRDVLSELTDEARPLVVDGSDGLRTTLLPARDAVLTGGLQRSSRHPNCSFITNWTMPEDRIHWDIDVTEGGWFTVDLLHTCRASDIGSVVRFESSHSDGSPTKPCVIHISQPAEAPDIGAAEDRVPRTESLVRDFASLPPGTRRLFLHPGPQRLTLAATEIAGQQVMDLRMLVLRRE